MNQSVPKIPAIKIFVSSTTQDLAQYRKKAAEIIKNIAKEKNEKVHIAEWSMDNKVQSGDGKRPVAVSTSWVEEADWVVLIVGFYYGTITDEEGADGRSVTEWEYDHAKNRKKKVFLFIAGDPKTEEAYNFSPTSEKVDLKNWLFEDIQSSEQRIKLTLFRQKLLKNEAGIFKDFGTFCIKLEDTLKRNIDLFLSEIQPATPLADLILEMRDYIGDCIKKVKLIARYKKIHDHLHDILKEVIWPLRDGVLQKCPQSNPLNEQMKLRIEKRMGKAWRQIGRIESVIALLKEDGFDVDHLLCNSLDGLQMFEDTWDKELDSTDSRINVDRVVDIVDDFASYVQWAFHSADDSMSKEEKKLSKGYEALKESLKRAQDERKLSPSDNHRLDAEFRKVEPNRERVNNALTTHHEWQEIHNQIHQIDNLRNSKQFDKDLKKFCRTWLTNLIVHVDEELNRAQDSAGLMTPSNEHEIFIINLQRLKRNLDALVIEQNEERFYNMRSAFDDSFYYIDKKTLKEVEASSSCVVEFEKRLGELAKSHRQVN